MGLFGGWAALERGYHAMTFDGPGQQATLFAAAEGASCRCEPLGLAIRDTRVFDWLDPYLGPRGSRS